jgi:hypothetical protein
MYPAHRSTHSLKFNMFGNSELQPHEPIIKPILNKVMYPLYHYTDFAENQYGESIPITRNKIQRKVLIIVCTALWCKPFSLLLQL